MASFQKIIIVGHVGREPDMRYTPSGQGVTNFSVATSEKWTNASGEKIEETVWMRVSTWGKLAEVCNNYVNKGSRVLVEGKLKPINVYTKNDGTPGASYEIKADRVVFLDSKGQKEEIQDLDGHARDDYADVPF